MYLIAISDIIIPAGRQRAEGKDQRSLEGLKKSIHDVGLIHPPVLSDTHTLVVGERRLLAIKELYEDGLQFKHNGELIPIGMIPYTRVLEAPEVLLQEMEYDENFWRLNLTWQEQAAAHVRIHTLRQATNPAQTLQQTATEIAAKKTPTAEPPTPKAISAEAFRLSKLKTVVDNMSNPVVAQAPSVEKAYTALLDQRKRNLERDLIRLNPQSTPHTLIHGDFVEVASTLDQGSYDLILCDPPYGINAHTAGSGALSHAYDDTPARALDLIRSIFRLGWGLLKPMGTLFMFCDIEHYITIRTMAEQQAFGTFRTPLVWHKGTEGHAPWGREGPKRTYELALYAVKGQRSLALSFGPDVISIPRSTVDPSRVHAAEKPAELLRFLVQKSLRAGDRVLDPCCGSGPIFAAVQDLGIHATGIELDTEYHAMAASRLIRLADGTDAAPDSLTAHPETVGDVLSRLTELTQ